MDSTAVSQNNRLVWYFILCWTVFNIIQSATLELHADEAYYWIYSRFLAWGYFDHPPMVAVFIKLGYALFQNEFGVRLLTVCCSSIALYTIWLVVRQYGVRALWFNLIIAGTFIFNIYGFTTTPDVPLFLFTVLFFYFYKKYLEDDNIKLTLLLALIIACLLYSKYHAVLVIGFTIISNPALLKRKSFWLMTGVATLLFLPHILWQVKHGYPTITYHLFDRSEAGYRIDQTLGYIPAQLAMGGPFIGWFIFYAAFRNKATDPFKRGLVVNAAGTFIFFLLNSLKGIVEPHWTLIAFIPLVILALISIHEAGKPYTWLMRLAAVNLVFIFVLRACLIFGPAWLRKVDQFKSYYGFKDWAHLVKQKAGDHYVIMSEGFQNPSKYDFYNNTTKGMSYDARDYRRTQFSLWPIEDSLQHKRIYLLLNWNNPAVTRDTIQNEAGTWFGGWVDDVRTYQKVTIAVNTKEVKAKPGQKLQFDLTITNPYPFAITFANLGVKHPVFLETCFFIHTTPVDVQQAGGDFNRISLQKGQSALYKITAIAPQKPGKYDLFFSLRTEPFTGSRNSRFIKLIVE
ncbi:glycosyltransferase family 39 protein [Mucilaginibacter achroorhodeus]|uniref:Glycosyltransferase family 39 protein n=1 Tax=Mucilaginibacter achroorhodeus TaxID=2599294 RepID=A0A563TYU7_9SPHI|nr:glycosyltransferase family 39 protein [Mucilaginibacter achroorhodeus]TWR24534.1 glycosyltransferase family 39 protein [Mucilaginibacter achroorhodeus]